MKKLPKSKNKLGYTEEEVQNICKQLHIDINKFWATFGINTCAVDKKGNSLYYLVDIERALFELGCKLGKFHYWD